MEILGTSDQIYIYLNDYEVKCLGKKPLSGIVNGGLNQEGPKLELIVEDSNGDIGIKKFPEGCSLGVARYEIIISKHKYRYLSEQVEGRSSIQQECSNIKINISRVYRGF